MIDPSRRCPRTDSPSAGSFRSALYQTPHVSLKTVQLQLGDGLGDGRLHYRPPRAAYRTRASKVAGMSERTWMPQWSPARVTIHSAGTVQ